MCHGLRVILYPLLLNSMNMQIRNLGVIGRQDGGHLAFILEKKMHNEANAPGQKKRRSFLSLFFAADDLHRWKGRTI